jgi:peptidoglycan/xylan/chitin deacetylase (PgdA/CDA1 family)
MVSSTIIYDDREAMARWKELEPALRTMTSPAPEDLSIDALATLKQRLQIDILDGPASVYTPGLVREIQSRGLPVWPDIQGPWENPQFWDQVVSLGAAGYQTDRPADFIEFLRQRGYREVLDRDRGAIIRSRPDRRQLALVFTGHELYCGGERSRPTLLSREELREDLEANLKRLAQFGVERTAATHFLPPYEHHNEEVAAWTREAGLVLISRVDEMLADEPPRRTVFLRLNQAGYRPGDVKRAVAFTCD